MKTPLREAKKLAIIPAYNEEGKVGTVVRGTVHYVDTTLVINDGSSDETQEESRENGALVIKHTINRGVGASLRTGIFYALNHGYDLCVILGADEQHNPKEIHRLIKKINEGYDYVQGSRYLPGGKTINMPLFRLFTTKIYTLFFRWFSGYPFTDASNGFRAFRTSLFESSDLNINQSWLNRYEMEPYILYKLVKNGYKIAEVPVTVKWDKAKGYTKIVPFIDWWGILKPTIYLKFKIKE